MKYDYNDLVARLQREELEVTFEKVDGTTRRMRCTLIPSFLPEEYRNKAPMLTETTPLAISVWDLDNSGWRSFRVDSIRNVA
jgi:uncharacterized protein YndB with AHSA1/START domain